VEVLGGRGLRPGDGPGYGRELHDRRGASLSLQKLEDTPTELSLAFFDNTKEDAADTEPIILGDPQPTPRVEWRREFPAVRRRSQVHRTGTILLQQYRNNRRTIACVGTFGRGLRLLALEPGDIVLFTSTRLGITAARYRVVATGWASDMKPALVLLEHNRDVYRAGFQGPNSAVQPGLRPPPVTTPKSPAPAADEGPPGLRVKALKIRRVSDRRRGRGGGFA
jgi:hypothetical protein